MRYYPLLLLLALFTVQAAVKDYLQFNLDSKWQLMYALSNTGAYSKTEAGDTLILVIRAIPVQKGMTAERYAVDEIVDLMNRQIPKELPQMPVRQAVGAQDWYVIDVTRRDGGMRMLQGYYLENSVIVEFIGGNPNPKGRMPADFFYRTLCSLNVKVKAGAYDRFFSRSSLADTPVEKTASETDKIISRIQGENYNLYLEKAENLFKAKNYKKAWLYYEKVEIYAPDLQNLAEISERMDFIKTQTEIRPNISRDTTSVQDKANSLLYGSFKAIGEGHYHDGFTLLKDAAYLDPKDPSFHYKYGGMLFGYAKRVFDKEDREKGLILFGEVERELLLAARYFPARMDEPIEKGLNLFLLGDVNQFIKKDLKKAKEFYELAATADPGIRKNPEFQAALKKLGR